MTKKTILALLIIALLFCGGCDKKSGDPNETEKVKAENAALKTKIQQLVDTNIEQQKKTQPLEKLPPKAEVDPNITPIPKKGTIEDANGVVKISKAIFGIYLGEKLDELGKRFRLEPGSPEKDEDDSTQKWYIRPDNPNIIMISVRSSQGYIYNFMTYFKDASKTNFDALKAQLEQIYGKEQYLGLDGIEVGGERAFFSSTIDGVQIGIDIHYEKGFGEDDTLCILYGHTPLMKKTHDEIRHRKASKVKGDL